MKQSLVHQDGTVMDQLAKRQDTIAQFLAQTFGVLVQDGVIPHLTMMQEMQLT
jgi:hypothetical protein